MDFMSWRNWFSQGSHHSQAVLEKAVPAKQMGAKSEAASSAQRAQHRRAERHANREALCRVVRESMVSMGVLSSAFHFRVLALDQRGRSFLVLLELGLEFGDEVEKFAEIEVRIAQAAHHRFGIAVEAVYWRFSSAPAVPHDHAAGAHEPLLGAAHAPVSRPAPLFAFDARDRAHAVQQQVPLHARARVVRR